MAAIINVLFEGEVVPVPTEGVTFISELVHVAINALRSKDTIRAGLDVFRILRDDAKALKRERDHVPTLKEELFEVDNLVTSLFTDGAHVVLLERKQVIAAATQRQEVTAAAPSSLPGGLCPPAAPAIVSCADADCWAAEAFTRGAMTARQIEAFNPFARSHHSALRR